MFPSNAEILYGLTFDDALKCQNIAGIEYWLIAAVTKYLKPSRILELGTEFGISTYIFRAMAPDAAITTVDISDCSRFVNGLNVDFKQTSSQKLAESWSEPIDILFIDTEHTYEQVLLELNGFAKHVTGAILLHDILSFPDVERAILDWLKENPNWTYLPYRERFGMGVLWATPTKNEETNEKEAQEAA